MIRYKLIGLLVLASFAAGGFHSARAQDWTQLTFDTSAIRTPYFIDPNVGFTFNAGIMNQSGIRLSYYAGHLEKTTDGGITWQYLPYFDSLGCSITQLCFVSLQHGYASTSYGSSYSHGGIYETTDQGNHWKIISHPGLAFSGIYATPTVIFASEAMTANIANGAYFYGLTGEIIYSRDDGATWDSITQVAGISKNRAPQFQFIYGNRDSLVATVYFDDSSYYHGGENTYLVFSTDLGKSWQSSFLDSVYKFPMVTLHISPHTCNIIRSYADSLDRIEALNCFLESSPPYTQWDSVLLRYPSSAWVSGNACAMYVCEGEKAVRSPAPYRRSMNNGASWSPLDSNSANGYDDEYDEIDSYDWQNISVVGYGAVVYAADERDRLMKTTDGGDGSLSAGALVPRIEFGRGQFPTYNDTLYVMQCTAASAFLYYQNLACAITKLDSISIDGLEPYEYSLSSTNHNDCLSLPDTTFINFTSFASGTREVTVNAHFTDDEYNTIDTSVSFTLIVGPGVAPEALNFALKPTTISTRPGDTIEIPVYLSGSPTVGATAVMLPFGLDTNVLQPIEFRTTISGIAAGTLSYSNDAQMVPLQSAGLTLNGVEQVGSLRCRVYLSDTTFTTVAFANSSLATVNAPCVGLSLGTDTVNIVISACGDQTLMEFMRTDSIPLGIQSITPNPAGGAVQIGFINPTSAPISYRVIDALGETRLSGVAVGNALSLDVSSLAQGVYFLRAASPVGIQCGRQFVIMR